MNKQNEPNLFNTVEFSKNQLEAIFDHLEPMCLVDADYKVIRLNRGMADLISKDYQECLGQPLQKLFLEWDHKLFMNNMNLAIFSRRTIKIHDYAMNEGGKRGWYEITFYPVIDKDQTVNECVIYIKDVTELYLTKKILLEQYNKLEEQQMMVENKNTLLIETQKSLDEAYQALLEDLNVAQEVQQGTMPTELPNIPGVNFYSSYDPISKVGGDIYDILELGNNKIGVFIGDVSGHGLAPAFVGAMVKMSLVDHAYNHQSPKELFTIMNDNLVSHLKSGHYLTAFYGILDMSTNMFLYAKASHPNPLLIREGGEVLELETGGMFLGLIETPEYEEKCIQLKSGDRLYFFTDGYYEVKGSNGKQIGYAGLKRMIQGVNHHSCKKAHLALGEELSRQIGENEPDDDRTFLIMEVKNKKWHARPKVLEYFSKNESFAIHSFSTEGEFYKIFAELEEYLDKKIDSEELRSRVNMCALELVNNALEHGNKRNPAKTIQLAYTATQKLFKMAVIDQGNGFDYDNLDDPRVGENCRRERGRGIFIVRSYMDEVYFNKKGNMITMIKYLNSKD